MIKLELTLLLNIYVQIMPLKHGVLFVKPLLNHAIETTRWCP